MHFNASGADTQEGAGRLWRFAECEFDELRRELRVQGQAVDLEAKPLDVLLQLLLHAGEVVTKDELLESVWPGLMVVDGSLATAISKLRKALGDGDSIILTVPRVGYRLAAPVHCKVVASLPAWADLGFQVGDSVPGREQWKLIRQLDLSPSSQVWLAEHSKTREPRVFKFASDGARLKSLKREVTLSRFLHESLGSSPEFVRVLEWNFDSQPFFLESEYCGPNLADWAEQQGGLPAVPLQTRLHLLVEIAHAVAKAHGIGVLHKDLKPANILMAPKADGHWQIKVADFGSASLAEPARLGELGITNLGFTQTAGPSDSHLTGTLMYLAPEVLAGQSPTASADVYALGVLLYQLAIGDFRRPLSPGWETDIADPLVREDVADAACGDPAKRIKSAADLAERLLTLDHRRVKRNELELTQERAKAAERKLAESRARRPWVVVAVSALVVGFGVSLGLYMQAAQERDHANRQTAIAISINQFLSDDLLGRSNPFLSGKASESLVDAVKQASPNIDLQFKDEPLVAARLHQTIAKALDNRTNYGDARREYERAAQLFSQTEGPDSQDAIVVRLQLAAMLARTYEKGSLPEAKQILAEEEAKLAKISNPRPDMPVWVSTAKGMIALIENDAPSASQNFREALAQAQGLPMFDESARLTLKQRLGFSYIRLGDGVKAEQAFRELIQEFTRVAGPESPNVLRVRLNLAQAYMIQNKHAEAVAEANAIYPQFVARLGEDHELTMQLLTTRAQSEGSLGLWADAFRDDMAIYKIALRKQGPLSFFSVVTLSDAGLAQCRGGHPADGEVNARKAYEAARKGFGQESAIAGGTAYAVAACLIDLGRLPEAASLLAGIDSPKVAQLAGIADWGANVDLAQAEIAYRRKNFAVARKYLESATPAFTRPGAEAYQRQKLETLSAALEKAPISD
ncbi:MAG: tetratricopeptide repeat protein [Acidobacteria bacterium]|nr:tetratricopeptide repeat protein [Acidobacteriota bacterium]